jgi:deazaflavin-dependent oxidoreductase (nitroreductase family)
MSRPRTLPDIGFKIMGLSHRAILRLSGGRILNSAYGMPVLELRTTGRTTGQVRPTTLTSPVFDDNRVVLVASKGGSDHDPQWYRNLQVNPDVEIVLEGKTRKLRARTASADEKAELWPQILGAYKGYGDYQAQADRDIPVVICEPRSV